MSRNKKESTPVTNLFIHSLIIILSFSVTVYGTMNTLNSYFYLQCENNF